MVRVYNKNIYVFKLYAFVFQNALALVKGHRTNQLITESSVKMRNFVYERLIGHAIDKDSETHQFKDKESQRHIM